MDASFDYSSWSDAELARAQNTAQDFLRDNLDAISSVFLKHGLLLDHLFRALQQSDLTLEERLDCFARCAAQGYSAPVEHDPGPTAPRRAACGTATLPPPNPFSLLDSSMNSRSSTDSRW